MDRKLSAPHANHVLTLPETWSSLWRDPDSLQGRRLLIVLVISIPLWMYATTWDIVMMLFNAAADGQGATFGDIVQLVLTRILILPLLAGAYFLAFNAITRRRITVWLILFQLGIASAFSLLTSPTLSVTYYLTNRAYAASHSLHQAFDLMGPWQIWLSKTVQYSIVYVLGLVLLFGLNAFLRYKSERLKVEQLRSEWLEAKLVTLRGQLNPHFLFNSINAVVALIDSDPARAERMLMDISTLLRQSLTESGHEFTTLKDELNFIDRYLTIMKARYEDRLQVDIRAESASLDCPIPTFILVPLVENAIKHGVARIPGGGTLAIESGSENGNLRLTIRNCSLSQRDHDDSTIGTGMGLQNTRQRLIAIYGKSHHFSSERESAGTWLTTLIVPAEIASTEAPHDSPLQSGGTH